jgi:hypothetical protein
MLKSSQNVLSLLEKKPGIGIVIDCDAIEIVVQESEIAKIYWILLLQTEISLPATIISK